MKPIITTTIFLLVTILSHGQTMYSKTFGNAKDTPVIFLHGGPGYNCVNFEVTTAQKLADHGFFVIVYDRRGEGRSPDPTATFTFKETFDDLNTLYQNNNLKKAILIGHSFGGVVATLFAANYPDQIKSILLVGAPISLQETFKTIILKSKSIYQSKNDSINLKYISMLETMDKASIEYSSYCFFHAMQNGFYSPKNPTDEAKHIYAMFRTDTTLVKYASQMTYQAPQGFWQNEKYTTIDLTAALTKLKAEKININGLYGKEDGLYSSQQVLALQNVIGSDNLKYFDNCSHNVFIDQQTLFIDAIKAWAE